MYNYKIALLGSTGYVGSHFVSSLINHKIEFVTPNRTELNVENCFELSKYLLDNKITFVINSIGYIGKPNVDACENAKEECLYTNAFLPTRISIGCELANINWGHVSSGCIYNGYLKIFTEYDPPNFAFGMPNKCSYYSGTKALAESFLKNDKRCYIWRLRIPFSNVDSPRNYITKILKCDRVNNKFNSLTDINEFCDACIQCIIKEVPFGIYNLTNPGGESAGNIIRKYDNIVGGNHLFTQHCPNELHPIVPRSNCILDTNKATSVGIKMSNINHAIEKALKNWRKS